MLLKRARYHMVALSLLVVGAVLASACEGSSPSVTTPIPAGPTAGSGGGVRLKVGFAFAISGDNTEYGNSQKAAVQMAVAEINGASTNKIEAVYEDTVGKPDVATTAFEALINNDNVHVIVGPTLSQEARAADPIAQTAGVPVLAVSNTVGGITDIGDYIFRDSLAEFQVIPETVKQAKDKLKLTKVALLYAKDDAFSKSGADVFRTEIRNNGIQIINEQTFSSTDSDYKAQLTAIKADKPDAIVVSALARPAQMILRQARRDVGIDPRVAIIGGNGFNSQAVLKAAGDTAEGLVVGAAWNPNATDEQSKTFTRKYKAKYGKDPDQFAAQAYAGVYILYDAARHANLPGKSLADARTAMRDSLKDTRNLQTVLGSFSFTDKRDADHLPAVQIVRDGRFETLR